MKNVFFLTITTILFFTSCRKKNEGVLNPPSPTVNKPPVANAGPDQTITLPVNSVTLNGTNSADPDNNIRSYSWAKVSGPSSFTISNAIGSQTPINNLVEGVYQFELKVTDAGGLFHLDTVQVTVNPDP